MLRLIWLEIRKRRNAMLGWGICFALYAVLILGIAPQIIEQVGDSNFNLGDIAVYQALGIGENAFSSVAGMMGAYIPFFGLLLGVYGVITGSNALAGEEDKGTLEMMLVAPVPRWKIVLAKAIAIEVALLVICLFTWFGYVTIWPAVSADIGDSLTQTDLFWSSVEMFPIAFFFAMLALFVGAYLPHRTHALGIGMAVVIGSYLINNLGSNVDALENIIPFQPFFYYRGGDVLSRGVDWYSVTTLIVAGLIALVLAILAFQRRNVTVGAWPWQRPKVVRNA